MAGKVVPYVQEALCQSSGTISTSHGTLPLFPNNTAIGHYFLPSFLTQWCLAATTKLIQVCVAELKYFEVPSWPKNV